jgi:hypothetical protein
MLLPLLKIVVQEELVDITLLKYILLVKVTNQLNQLETFQLHITKENLVYTET